MGMVSATSDGLKETGVENMAREGGMGSIIGIAAAAGLAYWAYSSGLLSSILGTTAPAVTPPVTGSGAGTAPATTTGTTGSGAGTAPAVPVGPCSTSGVLAPALAFAQKANTTKDLGPTGIDTFNVDQWGYYLNQVCTGLADQAKLTADVLFPNDPNRGGGLNWNAYKGYATQAGLSGPRRIAGSGMGTSLVRRRRA